MIKIFKPTLRRGDTRPAHRLCPGRAVDSEQLILKGRDTLKLLMNTVSQRQHIVVTGADDNAGMRCDFGVQADQMPPIKRRYGSTDSSRAR